MYSSKRPPLHQTDFKNLELVHRGKVRDMYNIPGHEDKLLLVATDRISAYDVVMEDPIPGKGKILTELTLLWLHLLEDIVPNHYITANVLDYPAVCADYEEDLWGRSMIVGKYLPLPIECIVRGYISGSMWKAYNKSPVVNGFRNVLGHDLRDGMKESEKFDTVLFTPSTKAEQGKHDENISFDQMVEILTVFLTQNGFKNIDPEEFAQRVADISIALYQKGAEHALQRGVIIADTKFELGINFDGHFVLIDEVLTPDSSRFWPKDRYVVGAGQPSFDKQYLRDYLSFLENWDKNPPAPELPLKIILGTADRYKEAQIKLCA